MTNKSKFKCSSCNREIDPKSDVVFDLYDSISCFDCIEDFQHFELQLVTEEATCVECNKDISDDYGSLDEDEWVCLDCWKEEKRTCISCSKLIEKGVMYYDVGAFLCEQCQIERDKGLQCGICGSKTSPSGSDDRELWGMEICPECKGDFEATKPEILRKV